MAGFDIRAGAESIKENIGYMSQLFSLYADLTVDENIAFFAGLYDVYGKRFDRRRAWVLEMSGLTEQAARNTGDLPLGWKQRLALGCAVMHEPPVLFLDEPTSGVDPVSRRNFWELIYTLADGGTTVFVSTHYMEEAEYCHRLALMNRGRLIALDRPAALREQMSEPILEITATHGPEAAQALREAPGRGRGRDVRPRRARGGQRRGAGHGLTSGVPRGAGHLRERALVRCGRRSKTCSSRSCAARAARSQGSPARTRHAEPSPPDRRRPQGDHPVAA